ncbi:MAG TPA: glycoside hydrolase family 2, partial [Gammaproteobacteria bacterium]|nr:glycoside hydrolase family 2 [Gammaproteobacteria bacterium]
MDRNIFRGLPLLCLLLAPWAHTAGAAPVQLGQSILRLDGPWKFHTGDDPRWAAPDFDDSAWETMDLSAPPDANDGDVGITPYTSGWTAKGHPGYQGYAWYRLHTAVLPAVGGSLALLGPWAVDSAYQLYVDGILLGGVGDFSGATPTAYGYHYPHYFGLPPAAAQGGGMEIAIRVWMGPWAVASPGAGGIHVAPALGSEASIAAQYRLQWLKIFEGYAVDVVPAL